MCIQPRNQNHDKIQKSWSWSAKAIVRHTEALFALASAIDLGCAFGITGTVLFSSLSGTGTIYYVSSKWFFLLLRLRVREQFPLTIVPLSRCCCHSRLCWWLEQLHHVIPQSHQLNNLHRDPNCLLDLDWMPKTLPCFWSMSCCCDMGFALQL